MSGAYSSHWSTYRCKKIIAAQKIVRWSWKSMISTTCKSKTYICGLNSVLAIEVGNRCSTGNVPENSVHTMYKIPAQSCTNWEEMLRTPIEKTAKFQQYNCIGWHWSCSNSHQFHQHGFLEPGIAKWGDKIKRWSSESATATIQTYTIMLTKCPYSNIKRKAYVAVNQRERT
jgi:hypothetical protein